MSNYNTQLQSNNLDLQEVLQTLQTKAAATPVISVSSDGLITATAGTKSTTHQLAFQPAKTITPSTTDQVAVSSGYYTGGNITVKGDANLVAGNIKSGVSIFGVNGTLAEGGGGSSGEGNSNEDVDELWDKILNRSFTEISNSSATKIGEYAFALCNSLTSVNFPAVTSIGRHAFASCNRLTSVNFPAVTILSEGAFFNCYSLTSVNFPTCTTIDRNAFRACPLTTVSFPVAKTISYDAFTLCSSLTSVNFPSVTIIGSGAFTSCYNLISISFPVATELGYSAFACCSKLTTANFPRVTKISSAAFGRCEKLQAISVPICMRISSYAFRSCYMLMSLCLRLNTVCTLSNSNAFESTPIGGYSTYTGTYGSIYVPASMLASYQTATNWTYFSSRFAAIESIGSVVSFMIDDVEYEANNGMTWGEWVESEYNTGGVYIDKIDEAVLTKDELYITCGDYGVNRYSIIISDLNYTTSPFLWL